MERKRKARAQTGAYLAIIAAILVVANIISYSVYKRFDLTKNERFTLSKGSAHLVQSLPKELQVDVYVMRGSPKHEAFVQDLIDLMNEYERAGAGKMHYTVIEPKTEEQRTAAREAGLQEVAFAEGSETSSDQAMVSKGFMGISFKYGSEKDQIPALSPDMNTGLEFWVTNKIREIRDKAEGSKLKIGVVSGKDEIKLSESCLVASQGGRGGGPSMKALLEQYFNFYSFEDVDLQNGEAEINKELAGVILTQPGKDYTEKELKRIDQFLMLGNKAVTVIAGAVNLKAADATMKASLNTHGLEKLLDGYGIEMKKEAILDWGRSIAIPMQTQTGRVVALPAPGIVQAQHDGSLDDKDQLLDNSFAAFFRLDEVGMPFPSTLVPHAEKQPEAQMKVVARSTPRTTIDASDAVDMKYSAEMKPKGEYGQRAMAIALEGTIKSAFGGGDVGGANVPGQSKDKSRLLVISASQFLCNPFARSGNPPAMPPQMQMMGGMGGDEELQMISGMYAQKYVTYAILALKNTLDWMGGDPDLLATSAKLLGESNLTYGDIKKPKQEAGDDEQALIKKAEEYKGERKHVQGMVQWSLTLVAPALFAAFGIFRWRRRESARDSISLD